MIQTKYKKVLVGKRGKNNILYVENSTPGKTFYGEDTFKSNGKEYREMDPRRSKLGAAIVKQIKEIGITDGSVVLYLGASHGYTPSFVSDLVGQNGFVFALDFAPTVVRDLVFLAEARKNLAPLLGDANHPEEYVKKVIKADIVYQDIAQKNQAEIFLKNIKAYLKPNGFGLLAVKARSIDITKRPGAVFDEVKQKLEKDRDLLIVDYKTLDPYEKDHCMFVVKRKM